jgi:hypothetical protein
VNILRGCEKAANGSGSQDKTINQLTGCWQKRGRTSRNLKVLPITKAGKSNDEEIK